MCLHWIVLLKSHSIFCFWFYTEACHPFLSALEKHSTAQLINDKFQNVPLSSVKSCSLCAFREIHASFRSLCPSLRPTVLVSFVSWTSHHNAHSWSQWGMENSSFWNFSQFGRQTGEDYTPGRRSTLSTATCYGPHFRHFLSHRAQKVGVIGLWKHLTRQHQKHHIRLWETGVI